MLGNYAPDSGCWLLVQNGEAAILELPGKNNCAVSPADAAANACGSLRCKITRLLCSHCHPDHINPATTADFLARFPESIMTLQSGFRHAVDALPVDARRVNYFESADLIHIGGEPIFLVHAPKHSSTDTFVIFKGAAFTGDWELGTIRSVHDGKPGSVPRDTRLESIARIERFQENHDYAIHMIFSVHANDRRYGIDFKRIIAETRRDIDCLR